MREVAWDRRDKVRMEGLLPGALEKKSKEFSNRGALDCPC